MRAGAGFNNSSYTNLQYPNQPRANANSVFYVAADRQLWQSDVEGSASCGIYRGFSAMYAPPDLNKVSQYFELRLYAKGLFDSRPGDQIAIVATNTAWSNFAVDAALATCSEIVGVYVDILLTPERLEACPHKRATIPAQL
ncbi:carbohydrate porin [Bradyrhizobium sp. CB3481]|nr:carbohydrate porin [Bradyrhizobium sp. CB3481]WFU14829.1 carbohydrate porin [Bradyrhizobium sp. CB3481]